jgi:glucosamine kinase
MLSKGADGDAFPDQIRDIAPGGTMTEAGQSVFVGVDGGGTHTTAVVGRAPSDPAAIVPPGDENIVGWGTGGPSNPSATGHEPASEQIFAAITGALSNAGLSFEAVSIVRVVMGVAGANRPADRVRLIGLVAERLGIRSEQIQVVEDVALILPAAGLDVGVALVAGTGSSAYGIAPNGRSTTVGGWGYLIGDEGSAFGVGRDALRAVLRADDGYGPITALTGSMAEKFGLDQPRDLIRVVYQSQSPRMTMAMLAPLVVETARAGDAVAAQILARAGQDLGKFARAVAKRLALPEGLTVVGTGGMFNAGELILEPLRQEAARAGLTTVRVLDRNAAVGALRLATGQAKTRA